MTHFIFMVAGGDFFFQCCILMESLFFTTVSFSKPKKTTDRSFFISVYYYSFKIFLRFSLADQDNCTMMSCYCNYKSPLVCCFSFAVQGYCCLNPSGIDKCQKESKNEMNSGSYNQSISARMMMLNLRQLHMCTYYQVAVPGRILKERLILSGSVWIRCQIPSHLLPLSFDLSQCYAVAEIPVFLWNILSETRWWMASVAAHCLFMLML